jgi:pilus assembly protein CpaF
METIDQAMDALLSDDDVSEVLVDGAESVYVERNGALRDTEIRFADDAQVIDWANDLLIEQGWEPVGPQHPWATARLANGDRITVVIPPVAVDGPSVTIRKFPRVPLTLEQLLAWGCLSEQILSFLRIVMQAELSILVSGGTSSGKTTLANLLLGLIPPQTRLVAVERRHEMRIDHPRVVYLEAEAGRASGMEPIDLCELLHVATCMRPDRIVIGELRGPEAWDLLELADIGHEGLIATIHARTPRDALARVEIMSSLAEPSLALPAIRAKMATGLDLIVQQNRIEDGTRKIVSIAEVQGLKGDSVVLAELFAWERTGMGEDGHYTGRFVATGVTPSFVPALEAEGLRFADGTFESR